MTFAKCVCVVLLVALSVMLVQPARAEALEPILISLIVSGAIIVIGLVAILIIANMSEGRRRSSQAGPEPVGPFVVFQMPASEAQSP